MAARHKHDLFPYNDLIDAVERDTTNNKFKAAARLLISAVKDWPTSNMHEPRELVEELKCEIKGKLTFANLERYLNRLRGERGGWKMEAVTSLLAMFDLDEQSGVENNSDLEQIISEIAQHYRQNK